MRLLMAEMSSCLVLGLAALLAEDRSMSCDMEDDEEAELLLELDELSVMVFTLTPRLRMAVRICLRTSGESPATIFFQSIWRVFRKIN